MYVCMYVCMHVCMYIYTYILPVLHISALLVKPVPASTSGAMYPCPCVYAKHERKSKNRSRDSQERTAARQRTTCALGKGSSCGCLPGYRKSST